MNIRLNGLPIVMCLLVTNTGPGVAFVRLPQSTVIDEESAGALRGMYFPEYFCVGEEEYSYNQIYRYKEMPELLQWLQSLQLGAQIVMQ